MSRRIPLLTLTAVLWLACGESGPTPTLPAGEPAHVELAGSGQSALAGEPLGTPLVLTVTDAAGAPVPGVEVTWSTDDGIIGPARGLTSVHGKSTASWVMPARLGSMSATAAVAGIEPSRATATATMPAAVLLAHLSGDAQSDTIEALLTDTLIAQIRMPSGHGLAGVPVVWDIVAGNGEMWNLDGVTDAAGRSHARWILGIRPGENRMRVRNVLTGDIITFTATALPGAPHVMALTPDSAVLRTGETAQFTASAFDRHGNAVPGTVVWITDDPLVATLSATGLVTAVGAGRILIGARVGTTIAVRPVTVLPDLAPESSY